MYKYNHSSSDNGFVAIWPKHVLYIIIYRLPIITSPFQMASISILVIGALDRYIAIKKPLHYHIIVTRTRVIVVCIVNFLFMLIATLAITLTTTLTYDRNLCICNSTDGFKLGARMYLLVFNIINVTIVIFVYTRLFFIVRTSNQVHSGNITKNNHGNIKSNIKAFRMFFIYSVTYVLTMVPFTVSLFSIAGSITLPYQLEFLGVWCLMSYPWWNVAGLFIMNRHFRQLIYQTFCWCQREVNIN